MSATEFITTVRDVMGITAGVDSPFFYAFLAVHLVSVIAGMGAVVVVDAVGFLWVLNRAPSKFLVQVADVTQRIIWVGWLGLVVSGSGLITLKGFVDSLTAIKLFLVLMVGINGIALHFLKNHLAQLSTFGEVPRALKYHMVMTGLVSQVGWWGALSIGFMHRHWQHHIGWPASSEPFILGIAGVWLAIVLVGRLWLGRMLWEKR